MDMMTVMSLMHLLMKPVTDAVYYAWSAIVGCCLPKHSPVSALKTVLNGRDGSFWPCLHLFVSWSGASDKWSVCWDQLDVDVV